MFSLISEFFSENKGFVLVGLLLIAIGFQHFRIRSLQENCKAYEQTIGKLETDLNVSQTNEFYLKQALKTSNDAIEKIRIDNQKNLMTYSTQVERISKESADWKAKARTSGKDCNNTVLNDYIQNLKKEGFFK
jgi:Fic family protein